MSISREVAPSALVVKRPLSDQIIAGILIAIFLPATIRFFARFPGLNWSSILAALFFLSPVLIGFWMLRTKISVFQDHIEERGVFCHRVDLPGNVNVKEYGRTSLLHDHESGFEYIFPVGLRHKGRLHKRLEEFFRDAQTSVDAASTPETAPEETP